MNGDGAPAGPDSGPDADPFTPFDAGASSPVAEEDSAAATAVAAGAALVELDSPNVNGDGSAPSVPGRLNVNGDGAGPGAGVAPASGTSKEKGAGAGSGAGSGSGVGSGAGTSLAFPLLAFTALAFTGSATATGMLLPGCSPSPDPPVVVGIGKLNGEGAGVKLAALPAAGVGPVFNTVKSSLPNENGAGVEPSVSVIPGIGKEYAATAAAADGADPTS